MARSRSAPCLVLAVILSILTGSTAFAEPECTCLQGNACYHTLKAPVSPPDDPCSCPLCRSARGSCPDLLPEGWSRDCATDTSMECFLRRHAASWRIDCSERLSGECGCRRPHPESCPQCGEDGATWGTEGFDFLRKQIEVEKRILGQRHRFVLLRSPHFYLVTDIPTLRVQMQGGGSRQMGMHEIAHVYLQRAEMAYQDFTLHLGDRMTYERPCAIFLLEDEKLKRKLAQAYFGNWEPELLYGADAKSISGGYGYNGLALSHDRWREDFDLHFRMRHLLGHLFISTWVTGGGSVDILPKWMFVGAAHWLSRLPEKFETEAEFCDGEGFSGSDSGDRWHLKCRKYARETDSLPIQRILDENSFEGMDLECHIRAWSWFDVFLREDRDRFVSCLAAIRERTKGPEAIRAAFGCAPEEFDRRWRERILGLRLTVAPSVAELDSDDPERPGAQERGEIRTEKDVVLLASRIRALVKVDDRLTAATLVPLLGSKSEDVREAIVLVLSRTGSEEVRRWLRTKGLSEFSGLTRARVVRIIGNLRDPEAAAPLAAQAGAPEWLTRANVARARGLLGDPAAIPELIAALDDPASQVRIAAMDALASFRTGAAAGTRRVAEELGSRAWQVRSTAALCLHSIGDDGAVDPLIDLMAREGGRVAREARDALKRITGDDLGADARHWREWWDQEKADREAGKPRAAGPRQDEGTAANPGEPTYYGIRLFSERVGFALDTSSSMSFEVKLDPVWLERHRRDYGPRGRKYDLACAEIQASLKSLDPRTLINMYCFRSVASSWKSDLVPATPKNQRSALIHVTTNRPPDQLAGRSAAGRRTNYVDVFRLLLEVKDDDLPQSFRDTPDTVFFLTDGKPTFGDITDTDTLLGWFREYNRFARLKVNVITFGKLETDSVFLRRLAEENGGQLIQVPSVE